MNNRSRIRIFLVLVLLLLGVLLPASQVSAQEGTLVRITQVDTSKFPNVTVYVSVTDGLGQPVGVNPETIQIYENSQLMSPVDVRGGGEVVGNTPIPVTTTLVMDISGSMDKNNKIGAAKDAAKAYVSGMRPGDQAGLIAYDTKVYTIQEVTSDIPSLVNAISSLQTGSDTAMFDALIQAEVSLENVSGRKAIIVLTDGMDNQSLSSADQVIERISAGGLTISAIGFGDVNASGQEGLDESGLKSLTELAGGQYAYATDAQTLSALYQQYGQSLQSEYAITYISPFALRDGINRDMTVSLSEVGASINEQYNPGGVLPEVSGRSGTLFAVILVSILVLLVIPGAFKWGAGALAGSKPRKSRIKLDKPPRGNSKPRVKFK
jgi:Ca-activated chloride channel homolog